MNRELAIGLAFLAFLVLVAIPGLAMAWREQHKQPATVVPVAVREAPTPPGAWLGQDLQDQPTEAIPRSTVHEALSQAAPASGVEPTFGRTFSWPVRHRP